MTVTESPADTTALWRPGRFASAAAGLVITGAALGVAELLAALGMWTKLLHQFSSPLLAVGAGFITLTPEWLKEFAISTFGENDKIALQVGMGITVVILAALIGLLARRSPRAAAVVLLAFVAICLVAVFTRPTAIGWYDAIPAVVGGAVGIVVLGLFFRRTAVPAAAAAVPADSAVPAVSAGSTTADAEETGSGDSDVARPAAGLDRRRFFRVLAITAAGAAAAGALARFLPSAADVERSRAGLAVPAATPQTYPPGLSAADLDVAVPDQPPFITPNADFYRVDTALTLPNLTAEDWQLRVHGMVDREISLDYPGLVARPQVERTITLTCVSNEVGGDLLGTAVWTGTPIASLLQEAGLQEGADCVLCTSADGFTLTAPLDALTDGRDALFAVAMNGEILPHRSGFPVRMVVPGLYGYVSATKWLVDMKVSRFEDEVAYWTARGWTDRAPIKTSSRIDVPKGFVRYTGGEQVVVAGVAWAQQRGITSVELQVDDGPWMPTELSPALSMDTWRQWRTTWTATPGVHTFRCRATDGTGAVQDTAIVPPFPNGSTGLDSRSVTVS